MGMFKGAKALPAKTAAKAAPKKDELQVNGLAQVAMIDAAIKALTAMKDTVAAEVKQECLTIFCESIGKQRPESFRGIDGDNASASCELRQRSSASALTEDEQAFLESEGLASTLVKNVAVQHLFAINPAYAADDKLLGKVEKALKNIVPEDFIVEQVEVSKTVVSADTLDVAFRNSKTSREAIAMITTLALKPKLKKTDLVAILAELSELFTEEDEAAVPAALPKVKKAA